MNKGEVSSENNELWYSYCLRTATVRMRARVALDEVEWVRDHITPFYNLIERALI